MKWLAYTIGEVQYLVNEQQIKEAGSLEEAAKKLHEAGKPTVKTESKKAQPEK